MDKVIPRSHSRDGLAETVVGIAKNYIPYGNIASEGTVMQVSRLSLPMTELY